MRQTTIIRIIKAWAWWWLPVCVGVVLRLANLPQQMLGDDELHVIRIITGESIAWILTHYSATDYGLPLALFFKGWMVLSWPLTEMTLRLPMLVSGLLFLAGMPLIIRRLAGASVAGWFIWLLAIAPSLVFYSRIVRTYMPVTLLAYGAVWCFYFWLIEGRRRWAMGYVLLAALAVYWHLVAFPFVLAPLFFAVGRKWLAPNVVMISWSQLLFLGVMAGGVIFLFQLPALPSLMALSASKQGVGTIEWVTLQENLYLQAGSRWPLLVSLFWLLAAGGWVYLYRLRPEVAGFTVCLGLSHLVGLGLLAPYGLEVPHIFGRYILLILPLFLLWVACGLVGFSVAFAPRGLRGWGMAAAAILLVLLFLSGPFTRASFWQTTLTHHNDFMRFNCELPTFVRENVPVFYQELAQQPADSVTLLEYPWDWTWHYGHINLAYQLFHQQTVIGSASNIPFVADSRLSLQSLIPPAPDRFEQSSARYLVVHRDWLAEEMRLENNPCLGLPLEATDSRGRDPRWLTWRTSAQEMAHQLEQLWGQPTYADEWLLVWDLDLIRDQGK